MDFEATEVTCVLFFIIVTYLFILGKQDYKKTKPALRATRLKAEAKRSAPGIRVRVPTLLSH